MAQRQDFRRIGLLVPSSSSVQEQDFRRVLPEYITLHVARMQLGNVEADSTLRIVQEIEVESQKLADVDVDVIIFPATAPSSRNGIGYDQELIRRPEADAVILACGNWSTFSIINQLERDLGKPVLTTNQVSLWHALKMMNGRPLGGLGVLPREHLVDAHSLRQPMSAFGGKEDIAQTSENVRL